MTWVLVIGLVVGAFLIAVFVLRAPRVSWEAIGAALVLGIAGYALQGSPQLPAAPKAPQERVDKDPAALVAERAKVTESGIPPTDRWIVIADALARNGQFADAAEMLRVAVEADPRNAEAWLALANSLVAHADGQLTPPALYAYRRATAAAPEHPGPPYFLGLAMAQAGRLEEARTLWQMLLERTPPDAPWHGELVQQLGRLNSIIDAKQSEGATR